MSDKTIKVGSIVTIVNSNTIFNGKQGKVTKIRTKSRNLKYGIVFPESETRHLYGVNEYKKNIVEYFASDNLQIDEDWRFDVKANNLFGKRMWHHYFKLQEAIDQSLPCPIMGCNEHKSHRALINVWGVVHEFDCCKHHFQQFNGTLRDFLPE